MTPRLAQLYALRAQVEALIVSEEVEISRGTVEAPIDPLETCPSCGADGETQQRVAMMDRTTNVFCRMCKQSRVVGGPQPVKEHEHAS